MDVDILRVITRLNVGGPARHVLMLSRELQDRFPSVLAAGAPPPEEGELSDADVPVQRVPLVRSLSMSADTKAFFAIRRLLRETNARVVDTHMAKAGAVGRLAAISTSSRPRTVHTFHGHVLDAYFRRAAQRAFIEIERRLARHTDVLISVGDQIRDELLDLGIGKPSQFVVVPLGIDLSPFLSVAGPSGVLRQRLGLPERCSLLGILGRLAPIKDHQTLIKAMTHLPKVHLVVLGDGELRSALERLATDLGVGDRVHFTGWWQDVPAALADLDLVVLSSRNEGTPLSLIEALASARPVVATDVGGVRFVVEPNRTGVLVAPGDSQALAEEIRRLLRSPAVAERFGRDGRASVRARFHKDRLVADMASLYSDLLASPAGRSRTV